MSSSFSQFLRQIDRLKPLALARLYELTKETDKAEKTLNQALTVDPKSIDAYLALGGLYQAHGRLDEAEHQFVHITTFEPDRAAPYVRLGNFYNSIRQWQKAEQAFQRATEVEPENPSAHEQRAHTDKCLTQRPETAKRSGQQGLIHRP